jgi:hypothetical protein
MADQNHSCVRIALEQRREFFEQQALTAIVHSGTVRGEVRAVQTASEITGLNFFNVDSSTSGNATQETFG